MLTDEKEKKKEQKRQASKYVKESQLKNLWSKTWPVDELSHASGRGCWLTTRHSQQASKQASKQAKTEYSVIIGQTRMNAAGVEGVEEITEAEPEQEEEPGQERKTKTEAKQKQNKAEQNWLHHSGYS